MAFNLESVLKNAGATEPIKERAELVLRFFNEVTAKQPDDLAVSEYVAGTQRIYQSIVLFVDGYIYEAKNFLHETKLDCISLSEFWYWQITAREFADLKDATDESSFVIELLSSASFGVTIHASGVNCNHLARVFKEHILRSLLPR